MTQLLPPSNFVQDAGLVVPNSKPAHKPFSNRMKKLRVLIPVGLLLVVAGLGVRYRFNRPDDSTISLSGRIESYESDLGAKWGAG